MQRCPHCNRENADGETYCYACGHILPVAVASLGTTNQLEDKEALEAIEPTQRWGTAYFDRRNRLQLTFRGADDVLLVDLNDKVVLGRAHDFPNMPQPDVDLTPFGAMEKGVSRNHLAFSREQDTIVVTDLGSANSTYLNGQRLMPFEPRILRDNDELRLGRLVIRVTFV